MKNTFFSILFYCSTLSMAALANDQSNHNGFFLGGGFGVMNYRIIDETAEEYALIKRNTDISKVFFLGYQFNNHYGVELAREESSDLYGTLISSLASSLLNTASVSTDTDILSLMGSYQTKPIGLYGKILGGISRINQETTITPAESNKRFLNVTEFEPSAGLAAGFQARFGLGLELKYVWYSSDAQSSQLNLRYQF